jgi:hypothetical protein
MDNFVTQPAAPAPVSVAPAPAPSQPADSDTQVNAYLDQIFKGSSTGSAPVARTEPAPVSPQQFAQPQSGPAPLPVAAPGPAAVQSVNGQPQATHENPLPAGVRQRIAELTESRRQSDAALSQERAERARIEGYLLAQQQQARAQQQAPAAPDMIADPNGYAQWVEDRATSRAQALFAEQRREMEQVIGTRLQEVTHQSANLAWQADRQRAVTQYGADAVAAVESEMQSNPQLGKHYSYDQSGRPNPYAYTQAVAAFRTQQFQQEIPNGDLAAYKQRVIQEYLSGSPAALNQAATQYAQTQRQGLPAFPQSLSSLPIGGSQPETIPSDPNDSLRQMFARQRQERIHRSSSFGR